MGEGVAGEDEGVTGYLVFSQENHEAGGCIPVQLTRGGACISFSSEYRYERSYISDEEGYCLFGSVTLVNRYTGKRQ